MIIVPAKPPNFDAILEKFPDADKPGVIFAYGDQIFNPSGFDIPPALIAHESVHCDRQYTDPDLWWYSYLRDPEFRYREELFAHAAEYQTLIRHDSSRTIFRDRNRRAQLLYSTARRLIAPLYAYEPSRSLTQAMRDLTQEINR